MGDSDSIFLLDADNRLERVPHRQYASEDLLQTLLEEHPELLVGDQINPDKYTQMASGEPGGGYTGR